MGGLGSVPNADLARLISGGNVESGWGELGNRSEDCVLGVNVAVGDVFNVADVDAESRKDFINDGDHVEYRLFS
jgi:hypothetical protein